MGSTSTVKLNVGGFRFETTKETLTQMSDSYFTALLSGRIPSSRDSDGWYFIDRDGQYFAPILTFLRTGEVIVPPSMTKADLLREAKFFLVDSLCKILLQSGNCIPRNRATTYLEEHGGTIKALISSATTMGETACPVLVGNLKDVTPTATSRLPHWYHRKGEGSILILGCDGSSQAVDEVKLWFYEHGYGVGQKEHNEVDFDLYFGPFPRAHTQKFIFRTLEPGERGTEEAEAITFRRPTKD